MSYSTLLLEKKDRYAILTLNRPDKLNALNGQLFTDLHNAIEEIETSGDIFGLILTGAEKAFAAGADIAELNASDGITGKYFSEFGSKVMQKLNDMRIPVIAAINGFALGGGCELAMSCHMRFASEKAKMGQPEVNLGILPGYGGTQRLTRLVGTAKSLELILTGKMIAAEEAKTIGLVNEVFPADELMPKTIEFMESILSKSPIAVAACIETVLASERLSPLEGLSYESMWFGKVCGSEDFKEGTSAFLEKRTPEFRNK